jgi:hypothetical protein
MSEALGSILSIAKNKQERNTKQTPEDPVAYLGCLGKTSPANGFKLENQAVTPPPLFCGDLRGLGRRGSGLAVVTS